MTPQGTRAVFPGSFDPLTNGHADIIERGLSVFSEVVVAVLVNAEKQAMFSTGERVEMIRATFADEPRVRVETFSGLLVDYARQIDSKVIVRGLRAISDFEYEFQMALMNRRIAPEIETVFMMPAESYSYLSSRLVKEISQLGGPVTGLVPVIVEDRLKERFAKERRG